MEVTPFMVLSLVSLVSALILLYLLVAYNSLIKKRNQVKTDYSDIDIQLRRRASLIQKLADFVKEYAEHEKKVFENVAKARSALDTSKTAKEFAKANNMLTESLRSLFAVAEDYPTLQASGNYKQLQTDLLETENLIASYREQYNRSVQHYNNSVQVFPRLLVAKLFNFHEEDLFQAAE